MIRIKLERRKAIRADCPKPNNQKSTQPRQQNENQTQKQKRRPTQGRTAFKTDTSRSVEDHGLVSIEQDTMLGKPFDSARQDDAFDIASDSGEGIRPHGVIHAFDAL